ncbi:MAG: hypothetical protein E7312_00690 [Clostridiales bacterium]|nr:hypothetical protein [Clostridiales bacterium]
MMNVRNMIDEIISAGITVRLNTIKGQRVYNRFDVKRSDDVVSLSVTDSGFKVVEISFKLDGDTALMSFMATTRCADGAAPGFKGELGAEIELLGLVDPDEMRYYFHEYTCWTHSATTRSFDSIHPRTQSVIARYGDTHMHMLMLCGDNFKAVLNGRIINVIPGTDNIRPLAGAVLSITMASAPYTAIAENFKGARRLGGIKVPLKEERKPLSHKFNGFGWCTWNVFEQDLSADGIIARLSEFIEKGIPVEWVLIDDGWFVHENETLKSFYADKIKFPNGLKDVVDKIKAMGVKYVGIWHAFTAYWYGIVEGSELYEEQKENLTKTPNGLYIPSIDPQKGFCFWDKWHGYLEDCGIDFIKVDNQSNFANTMIGSGMSTREAVWLNHQNLERSAQKHFDCDIINCMGMDMINLFSRPMSLATRTGEDFYPVERPLDSFTYLLRENVYNSVVQDNMCHCDYDMWWSNHETAPYCAVLRAISGSVNYVSDPEPGPNKELIMATLDEDNSNLRCDHASYPTTDCLYEGTGHTLLKVWNKSGDCLGAAAFNVGDEKDSDKLYMSTIFEIDPDKEYIAYEYFGKRFQRVNYNSAIDIELDVGQNVIFSFYPIEKDDGGEYVMLGNTNKLLGIASKYKKKTYLCDIL